MHIFYVSKASLEFTNLPSEGRRVPKAEWVWASGGRSPKLERKGEKDDVFKEWANQTLMAFGSANCTPPTTHTHNLGPLTVSVCTHIFSSISHTLRNTFQ